MMFDGRKKKRDVEKVERALNRKVSGYVEFDEVGTMLIDGRVVNPSKYRDGKSAPDWDSYVESVQKAARRQ